MSEVDLRVVVAEIYDDVQRRRRQGEYPPGLERELDSLFAQYAPPAAVGDDLAILLERAERAAFIDVDVPTTSNRPAVPYVKQGLRKVMAWYLRYVAQQVSALGGVLVRALGVVDKRVSRLEAAVPAASPRVIEEASRFDAAPLTARWQRFIVSTLIEARPPGRVVHGECGDGGLVAALVGAGLDAYGVDPRRAVLAEPTRAGLDVRADDTLEHLRRAEPASLGAAVVTGFVERTTASDLIELADLLARVLVPGGTLIAVSSSPGGWTMGRDPVEADLAAGRPLHAATWRHLLVARGFTVVEEAAGEPVAGALARLPDDGPGAKVMNANIDALNARLFPSASYAITARRSQPAE